MLPSNIMKVHSSSDTASITKLFTMSAVVRVNIRTLSPSSLASIRSSYSPLDTNFSISLRISRLTAWFSLLMMYIPSRLLIMGVRLTSSSPSSNAGMLPISLNIAGDIYTVLTFSASENLLYIDFAVCAKPVSESSNIAAITIVFFIIYCQFDILLF